MRTFTIDTDNNITVFASTEKLGDLNEGTQSLADEEELARLASVWPGNRLVEIWNCLAGVQPVKTGTTKSNRANLLYNGSYGATFFDGEPPDRN